MLNERLIDQAIESNQGWMIDWEPPSNLAREVERLEQEYMCAVSKCRAQDQKYVGFHNRPFSEHYTFEVVEYDGWFFWENVDHDSQAYGCRHGPYYSGREAYLNGMCEGD